MEQVQREAMEYDVVIVGAGAAGLFCAGIAGQRGLKVLVIDDSNTIRRSAEIFLKQGGHEVLLAEDGFDALSKVNDHDPDLIFCDILMPRLDGYQTCAIIKRNLQHILLTVLAARPKPVSNLRLARAQRIAAIGKLRPFCVVDNA